MADAMQATWDAMASLPRPVDEAAALEAAAHVLEPMGLMQQFRDWWKTNGAVVLARLNG